MPYSSVQQAVSRNPGIRKLPSGAQRIWVSTFNSVEPRSGEASAAKIAWDAVKKKYKKEGDEWMAKVDDNFDNSIDIKDDRIAIGIPFTKIDVDKRTVEGFATLDNVDKSGEIIDIEASREAFKDWMGNVREMHGPKAVGKALSFEERPFQKDGKEHRGFWVRSYISKGANDTWEKILDGTLRGYSVGGRVLEKRPEVIKNDGPFASRQVVRITKYNLGELSVVDNPANPLSLFESGETTEKADLLKFDNGAIEKSDILADEKKVFYCGQCDIAKMAPLASEVVECITCDQNMEFVASAFETPTPQELKKMITIKNSGEEVVDLSKVTKYKYEEPRDVFLEEGQEDTRPQPTIDHSPDVHLTQKVDSSEELQLNNDDDNKNILRSLAELLNAVEKRATKKKKDLEAYKAEESQSVSNAAEGGEHEELDKENLKDALNLLKDALEGVNGILEKFNVTRLNSEDAKDVTVADQVAKPAAETETSKNPDLFGGSQGNANAAVGLPTPENNVNPQIYKSEDASEKKEEEPVVKATEPDDLVKSIDEKLNGYLNAVGEKLTKKFEEVEERLGRIEGSGATKKSGDVNKAEDLKKNDNTFWGGSFSPYTSR